MRRKCLTIHDADANLDLRDPANAPDAETWEWFTEKCETEPLYLLAEYWKRHPTKMRYANEQAADVYSDRDAINKALNTLEAVVINPRRLKKAEVAYVATLLKHLRNLQVLLHNGIEGEALKSLGFID